MRALVALSGGVDSSVAAALMLEQGWDVVGVTLTLFEGAGGDLTNADRDPPADGADGADAADAGSIAARLNVPHHIVDCVDEFTEAVVDRFGDAYMEGLTPNPCIECNRRVRFRVLLEQTALFGCDILVTGHHARVRHDAAGFHLLRATDTGKDQSYVLYMLGQEELARFRLPIGEMTKDQVRERAGRLGLRSASKPDSQDLCFVSEGDYRRFLRERLPDAVRPGNIVTEDGEVVGRHEGIIDYTIGQRRRLGIAVGEPRYVVDIKPAEATVVVGAKRRLLAAGCRVEDVSFVAGRPPSGRDVGVKVRYRSTAAPATIAPEPEGSWRVHFERAQEAVTPGQAAVFYRGEEVMGGGTIVEALREP